jgi:hypothetical protein
MSTALAFAQYITLRTEETLGGYLFQNYWVNEDAPFFNVDTGQPAYFGFMPFAFSGTTVTKSGDNQPATLAFPNNSLSRGWAEIAVQNRWLANVRTVAVNPDDRTDYILIARYIGQIVSANWDTTSLQLQMASVLDAVGVDVPRKRLTQQLVGSLPITSSVRIQ